MNQTITISSGTLVVLSGLPGAGKSHLLANAQFLTPEAWVSTDRLRHQVLGSLNDITDGRPALTLRQDANEAVFSIARTLVRERLRHGLTTVIDATSTTDAARKEWIDLAEEQGADYLVLIVGTALEQCLLNMANRQDWVPEKAILSFNQPLNRPVPAHIVEIAKQKGKDVHATLPPGFDRSSKFRHQLVSSSDQLVFSPRALLSERCDVIGDVHGLYPELLALLEKAGWQNKGGHLVHADAQRRLLFLGDLVDRGLQTVEVLELVKTAVEDGVAQCLMGNHEKKLLSFLQQAGTVGVENWSSYANAESGMALLRLPAERRLALMRFMRNMPAFVTHEASKTAFVHADMFRFDPELSLKNAMVSGESGWSRMDSDALYEERYSAGLNEYTLIRGHIPQTSKQPHVFSLERHAFQKGDLLLLPLDAFLQSQRQGMSSQEAFEAHLVEHACGFDFDAYSEERFKLPKAMESLVTKKLAIRFNDDSRMLRGFKYSREVFWNHSWSADPWLLKARGLVLDPSGAIVSHPFDKVFNLNEEGAGAGLADDAALIEVEKLNGFLGVCSRHPLKEDLLMHTQGGFGGKHVQYIRDCMTAEQMGRTKKYLAYNDVTLMFEVIHPEDPHIIEYAPEEHGLYLIGVRGKNRLDKAWPEHLVDEAAKAMNYRRPTWKKTTKAELFAKCRRDTKGLVKHEGWMVREDTPEQEFLFKLKTPYYLVVKFVGRLSAGRVKHMFQRPEDFKKTLDEEFFPLVDELTRRYSQEQVLALPENEKVLLIRNLVTELIA